MFNNANKSEKVSDNIIAQIRDAILSGRLKPGDRLASEKELIEQFGVSKATMREALRVLEVIGLLEIRKGIAGGAFVAEVDMRTTLHAIVNFLHFQTVSVKEITMLRYLIEPSVAQVAAAKRTDKDIEKLQQVIGAGITPGDTEVSKEISFHRYLARMTENTILTLTIDMIDNLLKSMKKKIGLPPEFYGHVRDAHNIILECLIQQDGLAAKTAMANDVVGVGRYICGFTGALPFEPSELTASRSPIDTHLEVNPGARVVVKDDPLLQESGIIVRRVGTSELYLVVKEDENDVLDRPPSAS
ncbi:MAG: FadR family transcriptional regulator [Thermodesulfobacteriota bacterium]|nr:FadR family transcriptional regulator [Thermodesulfobacteriota bacterium]